MLRWDEDHMSKLINRTPAKVNFAGLSGDTYQMVKYGWTLNVRTDRNEWRDSISIRIGGNHPGLNLYMMSAPFELDYEFFARQASATEYQMMNMISKVTWEIKIDQVARNMIMSIHGEMQGRVVSRDWSGYMDIRNPTSEMNLRDFFEFPERSTEIFIPENKIWTVQEHLDAIKSAQQPMQDGILRDSIMNTGNNKQLLKLVAV